MPTLKNEEIEPLLFQQDIAAPDMLSIKRQIS